MIFVPCYRDGMTKTTADWKAQAKQIIRAELKRRDLSYVDLAQRMVLLDSFATFQGIVDRLREQGPPPGWQAGAQFHVAVPKGPNERW